MMPYSLMSLSRKEPDKYVSEIAPPESTVLAVRANGSLMYVDGAVRASTPLLVAVLVASKNSLAVGRTRVRVSSLTTQCLMGKSGLHERLYMEHSI